MRDSAGRMRWITRRPLMDAGLRVFKAALTLTLSRRERGPESLPLPPERAGVRDSAGRVAIALPQGWPVLKAAPTLTLPGGGPDGTLSSRGENRPPLQSPQGP